MPPQEDGSDVVSHMQAALEYGGRAEAIRKGRFNMEGFGCSIEASL